MYSDQSKSSPLFSYQKTVSSMQDIQWDNHLRTRKIVRKQIKIPHWVLLGFPDSSVGKESACNAGDSGSFPGLGRSTGEGKGYLLQYSGLENSMDCISMGLQRVWHDWVTDFTSFHWVLLEAPKLEKKECKKQTKIVLKLNSNP